MAATNNISLPTLADVEQAAERIGPYIHRTPIETCEQINHLAGCRLSFKCENLQKVGAFKARGATNAVLRLSDQQAVLGVATHSSGNHGAALAWAAKNRDIPAYIVMPNNASEVKKQAVAGYGAQIIYCEPTLAARKNTLESVIAKTQAHFIPPYDHHDVICGQGSVALEVLEQLAEDLPDTIITPVGGGGLIAGVATVIKAKNIGCKVIAAEPVGADDAYRSFNSGRLVTEHSPNTLADGLLTTLGNINYQVMVDKVDDILLADDQQIVEAMQIIWTRMKLVVEPSAAISLAVVLANKKRFSGQHIVLVLSGGNVDLQRLPW